MQQSVLALDFALGPGEEIVVVGAPGGRTAEVLAAIRRRFRPYAVVAVRPPDALGAPGPLAGLFAGRTGSAGDVALYRCRDRVCAAPAVGAAAVGAADAP